jgi:segregation and condensation protein A
MDEEPVEILVGLAERGEIDPWNIDIVEITDRFLSELERLRQLDLRISGRTLFYAATLLRLKSEYLEEPDEPLPDDDGEEALADPQEDFDFEPGSTVSAVDRLEREIQRRIGRKDHRKRPVTLYELIKMLKTAEKEERRRYRARVPSEEVLVTAEDVISTAHSEDYRNSSAQVLNGCADIITHEKRMTLQELSDTMGWNVLDVYIPLLFLTLEGKLTISQETFFDDIVISHTEQP